MLCIGLPTHGKNASDLAAVSLIFCHFFAQEKLISGGVMIVKIGAKNDKMSEIAFPKLACLK